MQRATSPLSAPLPFFSFLMRLSLRVVRICSVVWFLERFCNCDMEWTEGSVIEFIETRRCQPFLNRNGFPECCVLFEDFFSNQIMNRNGFPECRVLFEDFFSNQIN